MEHGAGRCSPQALGLCGTGPWLPAATVLRSVLSFSWSLKCTRPRPHLSAFADDVLSAWNAPSPVLCVAGCFLSFRPGLTCPPPSHRLVHPIGKRAGFCQFVSFVAHVTVCDHFIHHSQSLSPTKALLISPSCVLSSPQRVGPSSSK